MSVSRDWNSQGKASSLAAIKESNGDIDKAAKMQGLSHVRAMALS